MSIVRIKHNRENPYVQINKEALWNKNLSLKAVGLWARCLSRPDDWRFSIKELASSGKEKERAIYSTIDELIKNGYAMKLKHYDKNERGGFVGGWVEYIIFEVPATQQEKDELTEEFKKSFRHCCFGDLRRGDLQNASLLITKEETKEREENNIISEERPPPRRRVKKERSPEIEREKGVATTDLEHQKLLELWKSDKRLKEVYQAISIWKDKEGISGGNDFALAKKWKLKEEKLSQAVDNKHFKINRDWFHKQRMVHGRSVTDRITPISKDVDGIKSLIGVEVDETHEKYYFDNQVFIEMMTNNFRKWGLKITPDLV